VFLLNLALSDNFKNIQDKYLILINLTIKILLVKEIFYYVLKYFNFVKGVHIGYNPQRVIK